MSGAPGGRDRLRLPGLKGAQTSKGVPGGPDPEELPQLETHAEVKMWLERIGRAVASGRSGERPAQAAIRAVSKWVKAQEGQLTAKVVEELDERVEYLQSELAQAQLTVER